MSGSGRQEADIARLIDNADGPKSITGYCWPWTVRAGERSDFMISTYADGPYDAHLVRIICADNVSEPSIFEEVPIDAPLNGSYAGRFQETELGSLVEISPQSVLEEVTSFTIMTMVMPTMLPEGIRMRAGGGHCSQDEPVFQDQHLISTWNEQTQRGWALLLDQVGRLVFMLGDGEQVVRTTLDRPLSQDEWYLASASIDAASHIIRLSASPSEVPARTAIPPMRAEQAFELGHWGPQATPLRFGACSNGLGRNGRLRHANCFNGRLDRVRIARGILDDQEIFALVHSDLPKDTESGLIGFWDFSRDISGIEVTDLSANGFHGVTVNAPIRAVAGSEWDGSCNDWRVRPDHYSAIHFHDDDLYDAEWEVDFSFTVPANLASGIYAVRLRHGSSEDYIPFFVVPPRGQSCADVALLIPTATYTAYANITGYTTLKQIPRNIGDNVLSLVDQTTCRDVLQPATDAVFLLEHNRELGKGIYANHTDGFLVGHSSQRHPNLTLKPKGINWTLVADTYITAWLEHKQIRYDVITDDLLAAEGKELLGRYRAVITGNHPEYYTHSMIEALDAYQTAGGRLMYLGGNGFYWVTSFHPRMPGLIEVRKNMYAGGWRPHEMRHAADGVSGGLWESNGRPPELMVGVSFQHGMALDGGAAYRRRPDSYSAKASFIFEGVTGEIIGDYGRFGGGAAGQEVDFMDKARGTPPHALHLARADDFGEGAYAAANNGGRIADMMFFETPNGGATFSVGSMSWVGALSHNRYDNDVSRITENVLRRFANAAPFVIGS